MSPTEEDNRIMLAQIKKRSEAMWTEEQRCSNPAWRDDYMMQRLTRLRYDFNKNRLRIASGVDQ